MPISARRPLRRNTALHRGYQRWQDSRIAFNEAIAHLEPNAVRRGWQRDYMLGLDADGRPTAEHQTKLRLRAFTCEP